MSTSKTLGEATDVQEEEVSVFSYLEPQESELRILLKFDQVEPSFKWRLNCVGSSHPVLLIMLMRS